MSIFNNPEEIKFLSEKDQKLIIDHMCSVDPVFKEAFGEAVKKHMKHYDKYGNEFQVGSRVAFNYSGEVKIGTIVSMEFHEDHQRGFHQRNTLSAEIEHFKEKNEVTSLVNGKVKKTISKMRNIFETAVVIE